MIQLQLHVKAPFEVITMYMTLSLSHIFYSFYLFHQDNFDYEPNPISNENNTNIKIISRNGIYENYIQSKFFVKHRVCEIKINEILRNICSIFIHEQLLILSNKDGNAEEYSHSIHFKYNETDTRKRHASKSIILMAGLDCHL